MKEMKFDRFEEAFRNLAEGYLDASELEKTSIRAAKGWKTLLSGYDYSLADFSKALYETDSKGMVVVKGISFVSLCEHHLLPIIGECSVGYLPKQKIIGLSKIPRVVTMYARRLQLQERLTSQIAEGIMHIVQGEGVGVKITARHLCMIARGVEQHGSNVVTEKFLGSFKQEEVQKNFFRLIE